MRKNYYSETRLKIIRAYVCLYFYVCLFLRPFVFISSLVISNAKSDSRSGATISMQMSLRRKNAKSDNGAVLFAISRIASLWNALREGRNVKWQSSSVRFYSSKSIEFPVKRNVDIFNIFFLNKIIEIFRSKRNNCKIYGIV